MSVVLCAFRTNACVDLIVPAIPLLRALNIEAGGASDLPVITTLHDLQQVFHTFFAKGAAAERYFADGDVFQQLVQAASVLDGGEVGICHIPSSRYI